jgi:hypothetical protein
MVNSLGDDSLGNNNPHTLKDLGNFIRGNERAPELSRCKNIGKRTDIQYITIHILLTFIRLLFIRCI